MLRNSNYDNNGFDRLPPHSEEAEQAVLGAILLDPDHCMAVCIDRLRAADVFYDLRNQTIYSAMCELFDRREPIDSITLQQSLKDRQLFEQVGGTSYIGSLPESCPSSLNIDSWIATLLEKLRLRQMLRVCIESVSAIYDSEHEPQQVFERCERELRSICAGDTNGAPKDMKELIRGAINKIEDYHQRQGKISGISTGFVDLDRLTDGLHPGEMVIIAARPSMGKSSIAMNIVEHVAVDLGLPAGVFSLEMSAESLTLRMLCCRARVNLRNVREGFLAERDFPRLTTASSKLSAAPIHIDDTPGLSILRLRAKARRMQEQHGIKLFVVDYLQLIHGASGQSREAEVAEVARGIQEMARELSTPVISLCQLNRDIEREKARKPRLADLRSSGELEQSADIVGMLYRPEQDEESEECCPVNLVLQKQRNGPAGPDVEVQLTFLKPYTRFESASKIDMDEPPSRRQMEGVP